jgi:hypothetical protein
VSFPFVCPFVGVLSDIYYASGVFAKQQPLARNIFLLFAVAVFVKFFAPATMTIFPFFGVVAFFKTRNVVAGKLGNSDPSKDGAEKGVVVV